MRCRTRTALVIGIVLGTSVFILAADLLLGRFGHLPAGVGKRPLQPYLMNGGFYDGQTDDEMLAQEGPEIYGYREARGARVYGFERPIASFAERGDFLFQDRASIANDLSRETSRVFVIGGSAAYGTGASTTENRWYVILERRLSAQLGRQVRLVPAAMGGYVSTQELLVLHLMVLPRAPDAIVILDGYNDAALPGMFGSRPGDPYNQGVWYEHVYSPVFGLKKWLAPRSSIARSWLHGSFEKAFEDNRQRILASPRMRNNYANSVSSVYVGNVLQMLNACDERGLPAIAFVQPAREVTARKRGASPSTSSQEVLTWLAYQAMLRQLRSLPAGSRLVDFTGAFDHPISDVKYLDTVHFDDAGHRVVAETMYPFVLRLLQGVASAS